MAAAKALSSAERLANHLRKGHQQDLETRNHTIDERRRSAASGETFKPAMTLLPLSSGALACSAAVSRQGRVRDVWYTLKGVVDPRTCATLLG